MFKQFHLTKCLPKKFLKERKKTRNLIVPNRFNNKIHKHQV